MMNDDPSHRTYHVWEKVHDVSMCCKGPHSSSPRGIVYIGPVQDVARSGSQFAVCGSSTQERQERSSVAKDRQSSIAPIESGLLSRRVMAVLPKGVQI